MGRLSRLLSGVSRLSRCAYSVRAGTIVPHGFHRRRLGWRPGALDLIASPCPGRRVGPPGFADCKPIGFEGL